MLAFHINNDPEEPRLIVNTTNFDRSAQEMDREVVFYRQKQENLKHAKYKQRMYNDSVAIATMVESLALRKAALSVVNANESDAGAVWDVVVATAWVVEWERGWRGSHQPAAAGI